MPKLLIEFSLWGIKPEVLDILTGKRRTPQCPRCGRFCRVSNERTEYDGQGTQFYADVDCSRCGKFTESYW